MPSYDTKTLAHEFKHNAMATEFSIRIVHTDREYASQIADRCFMKINELELKLSRFIPDSDISRINKLEEGEQIILENETYKCLKIAVELMQLTNGFFDIGMAKSSDIFRGFKKGILNITEYKNALEQVFKEKQGGSIYLDPEKPRLYCIKEGIKIDLGGIGKGFTLDEIAIILKDHGIDNFSLDAGQSTIMVKNNIDEKPYWEYPIATLKTEQILQLKNTAVSASGFYWNDKHIFNPVTGNNEEIPRYERIWVSSDSAAYADAFSTAFFLMDELKITEIIKKTSLINWMSYSKNGIIHTL